MNKKKTVTKEKTLGQKLSKVKVITNVSKNGNDVEWSLSEDGTELTVNSIRPRSLVIFDIVLFTVVILLLIYKWFL
tara:strand:+ start:572 stop:799 length:228 start_codon:yes stop_codon:yes gene_type:complete